MAANSRSVQGIACFGKRVIGQIWTATSPSPSPAAAAGFTLRRAAHSSVYDKNPDEEVRPTVVPDDVIQPESDKYWAPHPKTGVFGPATAQNSATGGESGLYSSPANGGQSSLLEETAWFRPTSLEDLEKPHNN